ncbi:hypothetical protein BG003_001850, partial [Podila horticola]
KTILYAVGGVWIVIAWHISEAGENRTKVFIISNHGADQIEEVGANFWNGFGYHGEVVGRLRREALQGLVVGQDLDGNRRTVQAFGADAVTQEQDLRLQELALDVSFMDTDLMVTGTEIYFRKHDCSIKAIQKFINS